METALARKHTTRRRAIVEALAVELEQINGMQPFQNSSLKRRKKTKVLG